MRKFTQNVMAAMMIAVSGCGIYPEDNRLEVGDNLRLACYPLDLADTDIRDFLFTMEGSRLDGWSKDSALTVVEAECSSAPDEFLADCWNCELLMVEQIWGN